MKKYRHFFKAVISLVLVLSIILTPFSNAQAAKQDNKSQQVVNFTGDGYEVTFRVTSQWKGAFNADVTLKNTGENTIENWSLQFALPHEITNIWNGIISSNENNNYIVKNAGSNQDVEPGKKISFGFSAKCEHEILIPNTYQILSFKEQVPTEKFEMSFKVTNDWGKAFNGELKIKNISNEIIEDWQLEFDFAHDIERFWTAEILQHSENHYRIKNAGYNSNIKPNEEIILGFSGNPGNVNVKPENYILSNIVQNGIEYVDLPDGKIEKDYLYRVIYTNLSLRGLPTESVCLSDDYDGDGLTITQEYEYNTNPFLSDTDEDNISDYDEVYRYLTDPNKWDSDGDELSDGAEISCGLDPLSQDSDGNGIPDGEEVINQQVRIDSLETFDISESGTVPSVSITGKGDYSKKMYTATIENDKKILDIDCLVGTAYDFVHREELAFENSELTFSLSDAVLQANNIEDLSIAYYDEEQNVLQLLDTSYDLQSSTVSASVYHYSKYMVVNSLDYFYNIDWENAGSTITSGKADVVFVIDTTGSMSGPISNVRNSINQFVTELEENNIDIRLGLVEYRDIYADGVGSTKSYDWYTNVSSFKSKLASLGISGGGDAPESAVDALHCAQNMKFRTGVKKYIIMVTDANYKNGIAGDPSATMQMEIDSLVANNIMTSVVTRSNYYSNYNQLVSNTDGITGNILNNFSIELRPLITKMSDQVNDGCWIRLSNGSIVRLDKDPSLGDETIDTDSDGIPDVIELKSTYGISTFNPFTKQYELINVWTFYSNPVEKDTDGDGIDDVDDLRPAIFDTVILDNTDSNIKFNTGRIWYNISCNSFDFLDNLCQFVDFHVANPIPAEEFKEILSNYVKNSEQEFSIDELLAIGLFNNEGSKLYMDNVSSATRETVFTMIAERESKYYKHTGVLGSSKWEEVPKGTKGGFFKGSVLSEADINFSLRLYYVCDVYTVLDTIITVGALVIAIIIIVKVTPVILVNIKALMYYCKTYGVYEGFKMFSYLGVEGVPDGIIACLQADLADGESSLDDLVGSNIPIYQRGITGEEALKIAHPGESQKYFTTYVNGVKEGRFIDQYSVGVAYEAKVGYTCLSTRIRAQIIKDAWLLNNKFVKGVVWEFYRSDITGRVGATKPLLEFLTNNKIEYIIY
ncbi:MAG: cellulose binding domain-containing protein [Ruminiclostridium sp.]|nr:cellulose binding domain-containing protein [Ruminiclostridium sp.]